MSKFTDANENYFLTQGKRWYHLKAPSMDRWKDRAQTGVSGPREAARGVSWPPGLEGSPVHHDRVAGETWRKAFPLPFWFFVPTEVTPRNGTIKALDICVRRKLPRLETLFSPSLPRVQKPKSEFSPAWHPTQGRGSESKHVGESVLVRKRVREGEDGGVVNAYGGNADKSECWRCKNF